MGHEIRPSMIRWWTNRMRRAIELGDRTVEVTPEFVLALLEAYPSEPDEVGEHRPAHKRSLDRIKEGERRDRERRGM